MAYSHFGLKDAKRVVFHEITDSVIKEAIKNRQDRYGFS